MLGYKQFITSVEIDKLEYLIKSDPEYLTNTLSRAIIFGCETKFSRLMERIEINVNDREWVSPNHV